MTTIRNPKLDDTWRLMGRGTASLLDGSQADCYMFRRRGGIESKTALWSIAYMSVDRFWGRR